MALRHKSKYLREKTEEELPTTVEITVYDSGKTHINWIFFFMPCIKDFENNIIKRQCIFIKVHPINLESYYELSIAKKVIYTEKAEKERDSREIELKILGPKDFQPLHDTRSEPLSLLLISSQAVPAGPQSARCEACLSHHCLSRVKVSRCQPDGHGITG